MNKNKEINMINLKKVGLTALAGSLAAVTAQAGELSVTGSANVTYVTKSGSSTAQTLGNDKDVKFSGSGELDNGWTFAIHTLTKDDMTVSSTATVMTMGSMGSIGLGTGGGTNINGAYDEAIPTAYEENSDAGGQGAANYVGSTSDDNALVYQMPAMDIMGATVTGGVEYSLQDGSATANDGGATARSDTWGNSYGVGLTVAYDALSVGAYISERENKNHNAVVDVSDAVSGSWNVKYSMGPVSIGYSEFFVHSGLTSASSEGTTTVAKTVGTSAGMFDGDMMSIAFNVNDNLAISYADNEVNHLNTGSTGDVSEDVEGIGFSYTMGGMTLAGQSNSSDDANGVAGAKDDHTELRLSFAF